MPRAGARLYLVGGSFRALALLDMKTARPPAADRPQPSHLAANGSPSLRAMLREHALDEIRALTGISSSPHCQHLPAAADLARRA